MKNTKKYFIQERNDLIRKISNLKELVDDESFSKFEEYQQTLMKKQLKAMQEYQYTLSERLFHNDMITDAETKLDFSLQSVRAAEEYIGDNEKDGASSLYDAFMAGIAWMSKHANLHKSRKQLVHDAFMILNSKFPQLLYFIDEKNNEINVEYHYNETTDSIETKYASISLSDIKTEDINDGSMDDCLYKLEAMIINYFLKERGLKIGTFDD